MLCVVSGRAWAKKVGLPLTCPPTSFNFGPLLISVRASCSKHVCRERPGPAAEIHGFTSEYLSTQLATNSWGGHFFTHAMHPSNSPENLRKYADKCYFAWGSPNLFSALPTNFSLKQNDFPVWFGGG